MPLNANHEIERLQHAEDRFADRITDFAGSLRLVRLHVADRATALAAQVTPHRLGSGPPGRRQRQPLRRHRC